MFYMRAKKDIHDFLDIFNLEQDDKIDEDLVTPSGEHQMKGVFLEICFINRLKADRVKKYYKFLMKRKRDTEKVIDGHFDMLKKPLIELKKAYFEKERKIKSNNGKTMSFK